MSEITPFGSVGYHDIPIIETARLRLRGQRLSDLDPLAEIWGKPETVRYIGGKVRSRSDLWQQLMRSIGSWALLGFGYWIIEARETGDCIGELGFMEGLREITPSYSGTPEAGWVIGPKYWKKGYATEALSAALAWRDAELPMDKTVCIIEPDHATSIHIAGKFGFIKTADTLIADEPICIFERTV